MNPDPLSAARGCMVGLAIGSLMWAIIVGVLCL